MLDVNSIHSLLASISDPEIPVISIVDLGIVRNVSLHNGAVTVTITPTYSGCPAMSMIEHEIRNVLHNNGFSHIDVRTVLSPPWTTDWITDTAKERLRLYGIAPPSPVSRSPLLQIEIPVTHCPHCGSGNTRIKSTFGSTACKSFHYCDSCNQAFEHFKEF